MSILLFSNANGQVNSQPKQPGTIFYEGETYLHFDDLLFIHGFIAPGSRFNRYKAFKVMYNNTVRVISTASIKYLRVDNSEIVIGQEGLPVLKNAEIRVETKSRENLDMSYFELSWVLVTVLNNKTGRYEEVKIPFVKDGRLNIQKIILD